MFAHEDEIKFALVAVLCISSAVTGYCVALATIRVRSAQAWIAVQENLDRNYTVLVNPKAGPSIYYQFNYNINIFNICMFSKKTSLAINAVESLLQRQNDIS